jgi:hypothetical protein
MKSCFLIIVVTILSLTLFGFGDDGDGTILIPLQPVSPVAGYCCQSHSCSLDCTTDPGFVLDPAQPTLPDYMHCGSDSTYETCDPSNDTADAGKNCKTVTNDPTVYCSCKTYMTLNDCKNDRGGSQANRQETWCTSSDPDCGIAYIV